MIASNRIIFHSIKIKWAPQSFSFLEGKGNNSSLILIISPRHMEKCGIGQILNRNC